MNEPAVLRINARDATAAFHISWGHPRFHIPHLANFLHSRASASQPLTVAAYRRHVTGLDPAVVALSEGDPANDTATCRYRLTLNPDGGSRVHLHIARRATTLTGSPPSWAWEISEVDGLARLYREAARMMQQRAELLCRFVQNCGPLPPYYPTEQELLAQHATFQRWADRAESGAAPAAAPDDAPSPPRTVPAASASTRRCAP